VEKQYPLGRVEKTSVQFGSGIQASFLLFLASLELHGSLGTEMDLPMAGTAKGDEVFFHIASQKTSRLPMMDLEMSGNSASLASPPFPCEHLLAEPLVRIPVQSNPRLSRDG